MDLICAGEMLIDFTPSKEENGYIANPGGAPANVAILAARNGVDTAFLGVLGNDDFGKRLKTVLEDNRVSMLCPFLTDDAVTTLAFVTLQEDGERSFTFARKPGADILLRKEDIKEEDIRNCKYFHAGSVSLSDNPEREAIVYAIKLAHDMEKIVSFDINYRDTIWHDMERCKKEVDALMPYIDILKISEEELFFVQGEENIPKLMKENGIKVVVETLGAKGAKYYYEDDCEVVESQKVKALDATGAGDAFFGGFLSYLIRKQILEKKQISRGIVKDAILYGNACGGLCVQKMGGIPSLPAQSEVEQFLN